ncbi:MAG: glycosyltransferase family 2 protein [Desulfobacterales bacterium]|nr:glycosyltransferase family 2 protein [Desulfobacterales bacterium]
MHRIKISAVIITYNEERNIRRCLESLQDIADEIVVVDSYSTDRTEDICREMGAIFVQHPFDGHIEQKNYALGQANHDVILSLDADEALSDELRESIRSAKNHWDSDGYCFNRLTSYCGKWIRHCGWYPDEKIRLWDKHRGQWGGTNPHDRVVMSEDSTVKHLAGVLLHYSYHSIRQQVEQINSFSDLSARAAYEKGKKPIFIKDILLNPVFTFLKMYILQRGFLDGYYGFVISANSSFSKFLKYIKLRELYKQPPS